MTISWDDFTLDLPARRLIGAEGEVHVEPQVFDVLVYLVENRDRVIAKEELLDNVWGDQFVSESALTTRIKSVRRALGDDGRTQKYIRNVHGRGYQFVGEPTVASRRNERSSRPDPVELQLATSIAVDDEYPFVGRESELGELLDAALDAGSGPAQIFIGGVPGVGKSRLAVEVLERAAKAGVIVCAGRCEEHVTSALQPVRDAIAQLAVVQPDEFRRWSEGVESHLVALIPSLFDIVGVEPASTDTYAGIEAFVTIVDRASQAGSLLVLIDDLQWSDEPTRAFLSRLRRKLPHRHVVSLATYRSISVDLPSDVRAWISKQSRSSGMAPIEVGELDEVAATKLVHSVLGDKLPAGASGLVEQAAGHTLFLTESLRDLQIGGETASSVAQLVTARLHRLPEAVQDLVRAGAVLGPEFPFAIAARVAGLEPVEALEAIEAAVHAELLHETASLTRFRFSHQLVPESIRSEMSRPGLAIQHHRCALALRKDGADEAEVAFHLLGAVPLVQVEDAVHATRAAAARSIELKQFDRAVRLLEQCLDIDVQTRTRAEVLLGIGDALVASGRTEQGVPRFEEAAELGRRNGWSDILVDAALGHFGRSPFRKFTDKRTLALLAEASNALGDAESVKKARVLAKTAAFSVFDNRFADRERTTAEALAMAPDAEPIDRMELLESRAIALASPAGIDHLEEIDDEIEFLRAKTDTYFADAAAPETPLLMRGRGAELRRTADVDERRFRAQPISEWRDLVLRSTFAAFEGDFENARNHCDEAGSIGEPYWGESTHALHAFGHLFIASLSGEWQQTATMFELLNAFSDTQVFAAAHAWASAMNGDIDQARHAVAGIRHESFRWLGEHILGGNALIASAEVALVLDDERLLEAAEAHLPPHRNLVLGLPWACSLAAADSLSRLAARRGDAAAAAQHTATARTLYTSLQAPALLSRLD